MYVTKRAPGAQEQKGESDGLFLILQSGWPAWDFAIVAGAP
jgi:hypothetical protein